MDEANGTAGGQPTKSEKRAVSRTKDFGFLPIPPACRVDLTAGPKPIGYAKAIAFAFASTFSRSLIHVHFIDLNFCSGYFPLTCDFLCLRLTASTRQS
jgi:hypothetical protein